MKKYWILLLTILGVIISCKDDDGKAIAIEEKIPVVIDTSNSKCAEEDCKWREVNKYSPIYIGKFKDTIGTRLTRERFFDLQKYHFFNDVGVHYGNPKRKQIKIIVDTSRIIPVDLHFREKMDHSIKTKSYPVIVKNTCKDTLCIGYGTCLPLEMEAKDKKGIWRPIEHPFMYICGTGLNDIFLPPNEIVVVSTPVYKGEFQTKLRLRYSDSITSNEFDGSINLTQFEFEKLE